MNTSANALKKPFCAMVGVSSDLRFDDVAQAFSVQLGYRVGAVRQHGAVVDRSLVGDFAAVDGGRVGQQAHAGDAVGAAGGGLGQFVHDQLELRQHGGVVEHVVHGCVSGQVAEVAHRRGGEHHGTDLLEVDAGEHHVLDVGCAGRDDLAAQRTHAHEGAGGELEVFGDAAVELQAHVRSEEHTSE